MNYTTQLRNQVERKDEMNIQAGECEIVLLNLFVNLSSTNLQKSPQLTWARKKVPAELDCLCIVMSMSKTNGLRRR